MSIRHYNNPWNLLNNLQRDFYNSNNHSAQSHLQGESTANTAENWAPSVDISEDERAFTILADIPGVDPENIDISMEKGVLTIKGERLSANTEEKGNAHRIERANGQFARRFTLPDTADADKIEATSEFGVLKVTIPKQEIAASRKIEVKH